MIESLQSALQPHGPDAQGIADIAWLMFAGAALIFVLVMALTFWAAFSRSARGWLAGRSAVVVGGIVLPFVVLFVLLVVTLLAAARAQREHHDIALQVEVIGEQWWWRVHYLDASGAVDFASANEIRIPVGASVELRLKSTNVLHSLWLPSLAGKLDLIPGKDNRLRLRADAAGVYRGQCAEFCGGPHAQMALYVVALAPEAFEQWRSAQRAPAAPAANQTFLARCAACHAVRGTAAQGLVGPDLTHVGSRLSLGAGIVPNSAGSAAAWIGSGQHLKPGNLMPDFGGELDGTQLTALAHYLQSLR